jgi:hypothetical protein
MFKTLATATHPTQPAVQVIGNWITSVFPGAAALATACHELSHTLGGVQGTQPGSKTIPTDWCIGLPDTYDNDPENQNDRRYLGPWDMMSNHTALSHLAGHHKRHLRWIPAPSRILSVPEPNPNTPTVEECWLVPIEQWGPSTEGPSGRSSPRGRCRLSRSALAIGSKSCYVEHPRHGL